MTGLWRLAWRNLGRRPLRTGLTVAATVFAVFLTIFQLAIAAGSHDRWIQYVVRLYTGHVSVSLDGYREHRTLDYSMRLGEERARALDRLASAQGWAPRLESFALAIPDREEALGRAALLIGVDPAREAPLTRLANSVTDGRFLDGPGGFEVVLGETLAHNLDVRVGDTLILLSTDYYGSQAADRFRLVGTVSFGSEEFDRHLALVHLERLQGFLEADGALSHVALFVEEGAELETLHGELEALFRDGHEVLTWPDLLPDLVQLILLDDIGNWLVLGILIVVVAFGLLNTVLMSVMERVREFGVMRCVGARRGVIFRLVMLESTLLTGLGIALGLALSIPLVRWLEGSPIPLEVLAEGAGEIGKLFDLEPVLMFTLRRIDVIGATLVVLVVGLLAAIPPAVRAARGRPVEALRVV